MKNTENTHEGAMSANLKFAPEGNMRGVGIHSAAFNAVHFVAQAASTDEDRYNMSGIYIDSTGHGVCPLTDGEPDRIMLVATDGIRLHLYKDTEGVFEGYCKDILKRDIRSLVGHNFRFTANSKLILIEDEIEGREFPNWRKVMPEPETDAWTVSFDKDDNYFSGIQDIALSGCRFNGKFIEALYKHQDDWDMYPGVHQRATLFTVKKTVMNGEFIAVIMAMRPKSRYLDPDEKPVQQRIRTYYAVKLERRQNGVLTVMGGVMEINSRKPMPENTETERYFETKEEAQAEVKRIDDNAAAAAKAIAAAMVVPETPEAAAAAVEPEPETPAAAAVETPEPETETETEEPEMDAEQEWEALVDDMLDAENGEGEYAEDDDPAIDTVEGAEEEAYNEAAEAAEAEMAAYNEAAEAEEAEFYAAVYGNEEAAAAPAAAVETPEPETETPFDLAPPEPRPYSYRELKALPQSEKRAFLQNRKKEMEAKVEEAKANGVETPWGVFSIEDFLLDINALSPCAKYSAKNLLIVAAHGTTDARTFLAWKAAGRKVKKGAHAFYIFKPRTIEGSFKGYTQQPVFRYEDTEGAPVEYEQYGPDIYAKILGEDQPEQVAA